MKKLKLTLILLFIIVLVIVAYIIKINSGILVCTNTYTEDNVSFKTVSKVEYKNKVATKLVTIETITSTDEQLLQDYKTNLEMMYLKFNEIPHYTNTISVKEDVLTSKTTIDYKKISLKELIKVDSSFNEVIKNNKVLITKLKKQYKSTGAYCKYKN